jgi:hypothetical protein
MHRCHLTAPLALALLALIITTNCLALTQHQATDISQYVYGRNMTINKCYHEFTDPDTKFSFAAGILTIESCRTRSCSYALNGYAFDLSSCSVTRDNSSCVSDPAPTYI